MKDVLVIATRNRGKVREFGELLASLPVRLVALSDVVDESFEVTEDCATFVENAKKKARTVAAATMMLTLADDSGLEVDALGGQPGVRSARFAHDRASDAENNARLLASLEELCNADAEAHELPFAARFRCALALIDPMAASPEPLLAEGVCEGSITRTPRGAGGFGYDPLFVVGGTGRTMAELSEHEKNTASHRARAFAALIPALATILDARAEQVRALARSIAAS